MKVSWLPVEFKELYTMQTGKVLKILYFVILNDEELIQTMFYKVLVYTCIINTFRNVHVFMLLKIPDRVESGLL